MDMEDAIVAKVEERLRIRERVIEETQKEELYGLNSSWRTEDSDRGSVGQIKSDEILLCEERNQGIDIGINNRGTTGLSESEVKEVVNSSDMRKSQEFIWRSEIKKGDGEHLNKRTNYREKILEDGY